MADESDYANLIADANVNLPGAVPSQVLAELQVTTRDFLQYTSAWKVMYEMPVDTEHDCYTIVPQPGTAVNLLHKLFDAADPDQKDVNAPGGVEMSVPGHIKLKRPPSAAATWVALVSQYPIRLVEQAYGTPVPCWILERYYDTLLSGVLGRMMLQTAKTYTNEKLGTLRSRQYLAGRATARADLARSNVWGTQQWVFPAAYTARGRQVGA